MTGRYAIQERFMHWGRSGQDRLRRSRAVVVGIGGLGGMAAMLLTRAGVGSLRLVDPDFPSWDNLHRQVLFNEQDVVAERSKVQAAVAYLGSLNQDVALEPRLEALQPANALELLRGADVVLDGLDNAQDRYLLNEACWHLGIPLVHAGVVRSQGQLLVVRPGQGPCLRCWFPSLSEPRDSSASMGIIGPAPACLASLQAAEALKVLLGDEAHLLEGLLAVDLWPLSFRLISWRQREQHGCASCQGQYDFLSPPTMASGR
jgi:adenylyltransferase/sulfurtransferase